MTQKVFRQRIPVLRGAPIGPPRGLFDANVIAKPWVRDGYVAGCLLFKGVVEELGLVRWEAIVLRDLVAKRKAKLEGFV